MKIRHISIFFLFVLGLAGAISFTFLPWAMAAGTPPAKPEPQATGPAADIKPAGMSDEDWEKMKAKRPLPFDNGPATIDVSQYPQKMQDIYTNLFSVRCSKCHTIARPINAPYALPEEWSKYIKKMMKKPGSGIAPMVAKQIYDFLVFDSTIRKKEAIAKKLQELAQTKPN